MSIGKTEVLNIKTPEGMRYSIHPTVNSELATLAISIASGCSIKELEIVKSDHIFYSNMAGLNNDVRLKYKLDGHELHFNVSNFSTMYISTRRFIENYNKNLSFAFISGGISTVCLPLEDVAELYNGMHRDYDELSYHERKVFEDASEEDISNVLSLSGIEEHENVA